MGAFCHEIKPGRHTYTHRNVARAAICRSIFYLVITLIFFSSLLPLGDARSRPSKQQQHQQQHHFCVEKRKKKEREKTCYVWTQREAATRQRLLQQKLYPASSLTDPHLYRAFIKIAKAQSMHIIHRYPFATHIYKLGNYAYFLRKYVRIGINYIS